jgi:hypothetical protein
VEFLPDSGHAVPSESGETMNRRLQFALDNRMLAYVTAETLSSKFVLDCQQIVSKKYAQ